MSTWCVIKQLTFRVRTKEKGLQEKKVDMDQPAKSLEELETKVGLLCPDDRKRELLASIHTTTDVPHWIEGVNVPDWYGSATKEDISNALKWGYELVLAQQGLGENKLREQLDVQLSKELEERRIELEQYKKEVGHQILEKDREIQTWQQTAITNLSASGVDEKIQKLKQEWNEEQKTILSTMERERLSLKERVEYLQSRTNQLEHIRETMQERLDEKANRDALMNKSVHKGEVGEQIVDTWLRTAFLGADILDTSAETSKMDRHMVWEGMTIMIDIKNHDGKLHSLKDVKKFHDNFQESKDANIAILLCTNTNVPNHNRFWVETEYINDKLAIYMNNVSSNPIERLQLVAGTVLQPWKEYVKIRQSMRDTVAGDELKAWSISAQRVLSNGWNLIMRLHGQWTKTQTAVTASMSEFHSEITKVSQDMREDLATLAIPVDLPAKKPRSKKG